MPENSMSRARLILETMTPKRFLAQARAKTLHPGRNYYLAMGKPPLKAYPPLSRQGVPSKRWVASSNTEYCPLEIGSDGSASPLDGMYGLVDEAYTFLGIQGDGTDAQQEQASDLVDHYEGTALKAIESGTLQGRIEGPMGPREWALVYWPYHGNRPDVPPAPAELGKVYPDDDE
jgi:hypothetical protein